MLCCGRKIKIEAAFASEPIWCSVCKSNIPIDDIPIKQELIQELQEWNRAFSVWLVDYKFKSTEEYFELETRHNQWGNELTERIKKELGHAFFIVFAPSNLSLYMYG
ncbi:hypothetical protein SAMN05444392_101229 [Seinonella peptonophila]|uniref:Uncharacterized protein n=1 Tax=Seinonella peptonophila TaxID=112248 RepID=A0A1M4SZK7_9BACL|nr:hypothetical protein [Seinonella peptonophila]SHE37678.1 hypothetical protein SAMN05444392_101229 [Seinonella peptonophila]